MILKPRDTFGFVHLAQIAPHRILAHDLAHTQQGGIDGVTAQSANVGVTLMAGENRQHRGAQYIPIARRIGAGQQERAAFHQGIEEPTHLEKFGKEWQLPQRGDSRLRVPLDVDSAPKGIHGDRAGERHQRPSFGLTRWVMVRVCHMHLLEHIFQPVRSAEASPNYSF